jgi:UPF0716 protein FxsA
MRRGSGWLLPLLLVLLVAVPVAEVWLLVLVAREIGVWPTVLILIGEAVVGALLIRRAGRQAWTTLNSSLTTGEAPDTLGDAAFVLVGGFLLLVPGFLTDLVALVVLLPFTRPLPRWLLGLIVVRRSIRLGLHVQAASRDDGTVIEGEVVEAPPEDQIIRGEVEGPRP